MKEIRLCDDSCFEETINNCIKENVGIEIQQFHDLIVRPGESEEDFEKRLELDIKRVAEVLDKMSCGKSLHGPFWEMNVGSKVPEIVDAAKKYYELAYDIAQRLGCTEVVFHNGYFPGTSYEPKWIERTIKFWKEFLKNKDDIVICLENQFELDSQMLKEIVDGVGDKRLRVCLDIGHAHANSNMSVKDWIETLGDRIAYYHLHNNHGRQDIYGHNNDEHLCINDGTIDISNVLEYAERYSPGAIWSLESKVEYHLKDLEILKSLGYIKR